MTDLAIITADPEQVGGITSTKLAEEYVRIVRLNGTERVVLDLLATTFGSVDIMYELDETAVHHFSVTGVVDSDYFMDETIDVVRAMLS